MTLKAWIDNKIPRFCCFYGYTRYCGDGVWYGTCDSLQQGCIYQWPAKTCDMIIFSAQGRGVAICYEKQHINPAKTV